MIQKKTPTILDDSNLSSIMQKPSWGHNLLLLQKTKTTTPVKMLKY